MNTDEKDDDLESGQELVGDQPDLSEEEDAAADRAVLEFAKRRAERKKQAEAGDDKPVG